jgi:hypothetical protein
VSPVRYGMGSIPEDGILHSHSHEDVNLCLIKHRSMRDLHIHSRHRSYEDMNGQFYGFMSSASYRGEETVRFFGDEEHLPPFRTEPFHLHGVTCGNHECRSGMSPGALRLLIEYFFKVGGDSF